MLPTPSTSHVSFDNIYEPAEDSFLLLDALSAPSETAFLSSRFPASTSTSTSSSAPPLVVEVGTGSGVVLAFVTAHAKTIFGHPNVLTLGTDVNTFACRAARETVQTAVQDVSTCPSPNPLETSSGSSSSSNSNSATNILHPAASPATFLAPVLTDLTASIRPGEIDVLIFNPPYVPTPGLPILPTPGPLGPLVAPGTAGTSGTVGTEANVTSSSTASIFERDSYLLSLSYAGGADGMQTTDRLLEQIPSILHPTRGVAYVLLCAQNKPEEVKARIRGWEGGWTAETVASSGKTAGWEKLQIVRIHR